MSRVVEMTKSLGVVCADDSLFKTNKQTIGLIATKLTQYFCTLKFIRRYFE